MLRMEIYLKHKKENSNEYYLTHYDTYYFFKDNNIRKILNEIKNIFKIKKITFVRRKYDKVYYAELEEELYDEYKDVSSKYIEIYFEDTIDIMEYNADSMP